MLTSVRRPSGTAFLALLCLVEAIIHGTIIWYSYHSEFDKGKMMQNAAASFMAANLFRFLCHLWILFDSNFTAGTGNKIKLAIFMCISVLLPVASIVFFVLEPKLEIRTKCYASAACSVPVLFSVLEYCIYSTPEESESCLKQLKPWEEQDDGYIYKP